MTKLRVGRFHCAVGAYHFHYKRNASTALQHFQKALNLSTSQADQTQQARVLTNLGDIKCMVGDYLAAQMYAQHALRVSQVASDFYLQARALETLASCHRAMGDTKNSIFISQRARKLLDLCGMTGGQVYTSLGQNEAETHLLKSEYADARNIHTQIVQGSLVDVHRAWGFLNIAQIDIMIGASTEDVHENLDKAHIMFNATGNPIGLNYYKISLGELHLREGATVTAKVIFQEGFKSNWGNDTQATLACMESLANVHQWTAGDFLWASRWTVVYLAYANKIGNKLALYKAFQCLGDVFQAEYDKDTSMALFTVALEGFTHMDIHRSRAECMLRLGDLAKGRGIVSNAVELWKMARPLFERSSQGNQIIQIDDKLAKIPSDVQEEQTGSLSCLLEIDALTRPVVDPTDTTNAEENQEAENVLVDDEN